MGSRWRDIYERLLRCYGPQGWWPGDGPFEVMVGAILTQATSWKNVEKAIAHLKEAEALTPYGLRLLSNEALALLIRPCLYYNVKARKLKALARRLEEGYGDSLEALFTLDILELRRELLAIYGIGEETADSIILYAAGKPVFVIDAYTRRILGRLGLAGEEDSYRHLQAQFQDNLPADAVLFNEYHALLVRLGKEVCRPRPLCHPCLLLDLCPTGQAQRQRYKS